MRTKKAFTAIAFLFLTSLQIGQTAQAQCCQPGLSMPFAGQSVVQEWQPDAVPTFQYQAGSTLPYLSANLPQVAASSFQVQYVRGICVQCNGGPWIPIVVTAGSEVDACSALQAEVDAACPSGSYKTYRRVNAETTPFGGVSLTCNGPNVPYDCYEVGTGSPAPLFMQPTVSQCCPPALQMCAPAFARTAAQVQYERGICIYCNGIQTKIVKTAGSAQEACNLVIAAANNVYCSGTKQYFKLKKYTTTQGPFTTITYECVGSAQTGMCYPIE